jgi:hypothetical protein
MPKFMDYEVKPEVTDIMEKMIDGFPSVFEGFNVNQIGVTHTKKGKKKAKKPTRLIPVGYPYSVWIDKVYIIEVIEHLWANMTQKQKNLAVFHIMCSIPKDAFDPKSKSYAKKRRPDYEVFAEEFAVSGGIPNWMENEVEPRDPLEVAKGNISGGDIERKPLTKEDVEAIHEKVLVEIDEG